MKSTRSRGGSQQPRVPTSHLELSHPTNFVTFLAKQKAKNKSKNKPLKNVLVYIYVRAPAGTFPPPCATFPGPRSTLFVPAMPPAPRNAQQRRRRRKRRRKRRGRKRRRKRRRRRKTGGRRTQRWRWHPLRHREGRSPSRLPTATVSTDGSSTPRKTLSPVQSGAVQSEQIPVELSSKWRTGIMGFTWSTGNAGGGGGRV